MEEKIAALETKVNALEARIVVLESALITSPTASAPAFAPTPGAVSVQAGPRKPDAVQDGKTYKGKRDEKGNRVYE